MYGQIIAFLFILLILYYAVMIFLDIRKAKAEKAAELEKNKEEIIDISDEAGQFQPVIISRDAPKKVDSEQKVSETKAEPETLSETENKESNENKESKTEQAQPNVEKSEPEKEKSEGESVPPKKIYIHNPDAMPKSKPVSSEQKSEPVKDDKVELAPQPITRSPNYREPIMTDGYDIPNLLTKVDQLAESGDGPLANVIYKARNPE